VPTPSISVSVNGVRASMPRRLAVGCSDIA